MAGYTLLFGAFALGIIANVAIRRSSSRIARMFIGISAMILMFALLIMWMK